MVWVVGVLAVLVVVAAVLLVLLSRARKLATKDLTARGPGGARPVEFAETVSSARNTLLQAGQSYFVALTALGALGTLVFTARSVDASRDSVDASRDAVRATRDGMITDLYTKAVEELSSPDRGVRIGGVFALERIANHSAADQPTIVAVLAAFLQDHRDKVGKAAGRDAQAAAAVLARRNPANDGTQTPRLQLSNVVIPETELPGARFGGAVLSGSDLGGVDFGKARLAGADLGNTDLSGSNLAGADMTGACLSDANLDGADLTRATLRGADLTGAHLNDPDDPGMVRTAAGADFTAAVLTDTDLRGVDLSAATGLTTAQLSAGRIDARTTLPPGVARPATRMGSAKPPSGGPCAT